MPNHEIGFSETNQPEKIKTLISAFQKHSLRVFDQYFKRCLGLFLVINVMVCFVASVARHLYIRAPCGVGALRKIYGGEGKRDHRD